MSTLNVANITDGTTTVGASYVTNGSAKAWVDYAGVTTGTVLDSFNLSSVTDNGAGLYALNFTNSFSASNFSAPASAGSPGGGTGSGRNIDTRPDRTASVCGIKCRDSEAGGYLDSDIDVSVFGDLA